MRKTRFHRLWIWMIRTFFDLLYGPFAWIYDLVAWLVSWGQWKAWGGMALRFLDGDRVLELGHGPGHIQVAMAKGGIDSVGLDRSPQMGRLAQRRLRREGLSPSLVRARAQALPFRTAAFSDVVATFPTEYIVDPQTTQEMARVLRPRGRLVVVAAGQLTGRDPLSRFLEWLYRVTGQRDPVPRGDETAWEEGPFKLETRWVEAYRSRVLVATGTKREVEP